ncbi:unnamed protein product, partial [Effrenium voratum]
SSGAGASQSALDAGASGLPDAGEQRRGCGLGKFFALAARTQERAEAIMDELVQLLSLFASQRKAVRDTVLEQCVGESVCVLGLFLSLACFRRLFQLGKMRLARFSRGETVVDLRMKGQPRLARVACQEAKVRAYLVTLYTSTLDAVCPNQKGLGETLPHKFHGKWMKRKAQRYTLMGLKRDIKNAKKQGYSELLDATNSLQQHYRSLGLEPHPLDTVMVVKRFLWDDVQSQACRVVIPREYLKAFFCRMPRESAVQRAVLYLRQLSRGQRGNSLSFPPLPWMHSCVGDEGLAQAMRHQETELLVGKKGPQPHAGILPDAVLTSIDDVHDIFQLPRHMVAAMSQSIGADKVRRALQRLDHVTLTTSFSGCGMAETGVEALDPRYKSHEAWLAKIRADPPDVLVFENVERYPPDLLAAALGDIYHYSESNLDPSEVFSLPMARPRLYLLLWRKSTCKWAGPEVNSWIEAMAAVKIEHKGPFDPEIFAAAPDMQSTRRMTNSEEKHFRQYENLIQQGLLRKTPVVDLRQSEARPVTALVNGCLPTLRTSSGSLYLVQLQQFLSGKQLMRAQGWPVHQEDSDALGLAHVELPASVGKTALVSMAGNAMFGACPVLAVFAALLYIEKAVIKLAESLKDHPCQWALEHSCVGHEAGASDAWCCRACSRATLSGEAVVDWPRLPQWMNCLKDIVTEPRGYDNREFIKITLHPGDKGQGQFAYLAGKGFSRISALLFAVMKGADAVEDTGSHESLDASRMQEGTKLWIQLLGLDFGYRGATRAEIWAGFRGLISGEVLASDVSSKGYPARSWRCIFPAKFCEQMSGEVLAVSFSGEVSRQVFRFLQSARQVYTSVEAVESSRERLYEATLQSQMLQERRPLTIVSLAIKFHSAMLELGKEDCPGKDVMDNLTLMQQLLASVLEEYDGNSAYKLSAVQRDAIMNCILHSSPAFLRSVSRLLDIAPEKANPYRLKVLQTKRWIIGGSSGRANDHSIWGQMLVMDSEKQKILAEVVNHEVLRNLKAGRQKNLTLDEWAEFCDYSCWSGRGRSHLAKKRLDLNAINEQQQESQFKADMLSLNADLCKYCLHVQEQQSNSKAQKIALAAWVRNQVHSARTQVIEPFMQNMCTIKGCETGASQVQAWSRFLRCGPDSSTNGVVLKIFYCGCNKFGRMSDDAVSNMFDVVQQAAAQDPTNFAAIIVPTTVVPKKRLTGDRAERARLELKAENKGFIPILVSLRMSEVSFHGNDSRQVCYDAYVLIPESGEDSNPFTSSFLLRRKATMKEADWMSPSDYVLTAAQPGAPSSPGNLSLEKRAAHLLAGESVPMALFQALLHTSDSSPKPILTKRSDAVAVFNFCPHVAGWSWGGVLQTAAGLPDAEAKRFSDPPMPELTLMTVSTEGKAVVPSQIRKKWSSDPVYGPEWLAELRKCDELATGNVETTAAAMAAASSGSGSAATTVVTAEETGAAGELPAEWEAQPASLLDGRTTHTCATEIKGLNLVMGLGDGELDSLKVYLQAQESLTVKAKEKALFKMGAADWYKPPKSTRLLASDNEKHLYVFELNSDTALAS